MNRVAVLFGILLAAGCTKLIPPSARPDAPVAKKSEPPPEPVAPPKADPPAGPVAPPKPPEPKGPVNLGPVDGLKMQLEYATNATAAHSVYGGKILTLPVVVNTVELLSGGDMRVTMSTIPKVTGEPDEPNYVFQFPKGRTKGVDLLQRGSSCLIEGLCAYHVPDKFPRGGRPEFKWHLRFLDCRLVGGTE